MPKKGKASLEDRLHRIEGQIRGVESMVKTSVEPQKIMIQLQAVISGLESVKLELVKQGVRNNLEKHVADAFDMLK